jgi:hypothetical protein
MSDREAMTAVRLQVMWTRLIALVEEQAQTLLRTAFSPIVRESGDLSAGIFDVRGRMLAQAVTGTPGHINTMSRSVGYFIERFPAATMSPGDVFVTNDPWHGTGHLNDYVVVTPAFRAGRLIALFACTGHMTDVGGIGLSPDGADLFMEGVAVPIMKLIDAGRVNETLISIAKANSRLPHEIEGDIYSLVASNETAVRRLTELLAEVGASDIDALADFIVERSRHALAARIAALPQGEAACSMRVDGFEAPVELRARLCIAKETIEVDWSGTSQASRFGINVPLNYAAAYTSYALACAVAPDVPNNAGTLSAFEVSAPPGCILNAQPPQPVACRHIIGGLLPDVVFGCLDQLVPGRIPAESASALWTLTFRGGQPPGLHHLDRHQWGHRRACGPRWTLGDVVSECRARNAGRNRRSGDAARVLAARTARRFGGRGRCARRARSGYGDRNARRRAVHSVRRLRSHCASGARPRRRALGSAGRACSAQRTRACRQGCASDRAGRPPGRAHARRRWLWRSASAAASGVRRRPFGRLHLDIRLTNHGSGGQHAERTGLRSPTIHRRARDCCFGGWRAARFGTGQSARHPELWRSIRALLARSADPAF